MKIFIPKNPKKPLPQEVGMEELEEPLSDDMNK